jgi:hypothetical protein
VGVAQLTAAGIARFAFVPGSGVHTYKAVFGGNTNEAASSSPAETLSVDPALSTTAEIPSDLSPNATPVPGASNLSLTAAGSYPTGELPSTTVTADFNGDGILDVAVTAFDSLGTYVPGSVAIFLGKGDGTFTAAPSIVTGIFPCCLVTGDFNGDGKVDLAFGSIVDGSISIELGDGDGTFTQGVSIPGTFANAGDLAVGDFNGDGIEDLVLSQPEAQTLRIFLGQGDGTFTPTSETPATGDNPLGIAVGDFNHDGHLDLAVCNVFASPGSSDPGNVTVLLGNGDGTFTPAPSIPVGIAPESILAADFNGDGKLDLAVLNIGLPTTISMLFGNGDGTFNSSSPQIPLAYLVSFALGDFNGDGKPDIGGFLSVYQPTNVSQNVYALINNGDGTFASITASDSLIPMNGAAGDFNGDGLSDLAVTGQYGGLSIYLTTVNGKAALLPTTTTVAVAPNPSTYGQPVLYTTHVAPVSPNKAVPTGTVLFTFCRGATYPVTLDANGNGSFYYPLPNTIANPVGSCSFTGQYSGDNTFAPSTSAADTFVVTPAPSTTTILSATPNPAYVAQTVAFTVQVVGVPSPTANPVTGQPVPPGALQFSGTVQLFSDGNLVGSAPATVVAGGNGETAQATVNVSTLAIGSHVMTASYGNDPNLGISSSGPVTEVIVAAPPADFSLTGPQSITFRTESSGGGTLTLASINGFAGTVSLTCNPPLPVNYVCVLQSASANVPANGSATVGFTLHPKYVADAGSVSGGLRTGGPRSRMALAALLPLTVLSLAGMRRRRSVVRAMLTMVLLGMVAMGTTACGPDQYYAATPPGTYPVTFTGTGANQGSSTTITHTATVNVIITR